MNGCRGRTMGRLGKPHVVTSWECPVSAGASHILCMLYSDWRDDFSISGLRGGISKNPKAGMGTVRLWSAERGEPFANGVLGQFRDTVKIELFHDAMALGLDGLETHPEGKGDLFCAFAGGNQLQHLPLAEG